MQATPGTATIAASRPRKRSETRQRLLDSARELFLSQGASAVRVESVCQRAGYTRGAFYSNFNSIGELLLALYADHVDELISGIDHTVRSTLNDPSTPLSAEEAVSAIIATLPLNREWFGIRIRLAAEAAHDSSGAALLLDYERALRERLQPVLLRAVAQMRRVLTVDSETFARAVIAAHDGALANNLVDMEHQAIRTVVVRAVIVGLTIDAPSSRD